MTGRFERCAHRCAHSIAACAHVACAAGVNYTYDGDGNRLQKSSGKIYWYGAGTEILDESDASGNINNEYIFFGGKRIAIRNVTTGNIYYYAEDMLGSSRTMVQAGQTTVCYDADFYPFGGERDVTTSCAPVYKFEGKERDTETGNDDFGARYYASRLGRWLSADWSAIPEPVPYANLTNPQTLNLYAMVSDNPETFADLDGHWTAPYEWANWIDSKINRAVNSVENKAISSGNPTLAATTTFAAGATASVAEGFTNLLRTGESVGSLPENPSGGQIATAIAQDGGRVGGTILAVVAIAGPSAPATSEQGAGVASEIGQNRVTMSNGSQVDLAGKAHFEKSTGASVPTPHIKDPSYNTSPNGTTYQNGYGATRPATVGDVNAAASQAGVTPPAPIPNPVPVPQGDRK